MQIPQNSMPNEDHEPTDRQEQCLSLLKQGRDTGAPWGRVTPNYVVDQTGMRRQYASRALGRLETAGWVKKVAKGLYEFKSDPREGGDA
ncbi:MarR family transcriptional regulator [Haloarcula sp. S1AR25-4]|uniref:MarR family transcriptional regulator n=1 Tax=Haloarcula sp. S1AR25-4 TaxID=2950538 RepID=UPI0037BE3457